MVNPGVSFSKLAGVQQDPRRVGCLQRLLRELRALLLGYPARAEFYQPRVSTLLPDRQVLFGLFGNLRLGRLRDEPLIAIDDAVDVWIVVDRSPQRRKLLADD